MISCFIGTCCGGNCPKHTIHKEHTSFLPHPWEREIIIPFERYGK
jgi:hypothetical protein